MIIVICELYDLCTYGYSDGKTMTCWFMLFVVNEAILQCVRQGMCKKRNKSLIKWCMQIDGEFNKDIRRLVIPEMERDVINAVKFFFFKFPLPEDAHSTVLSERQCLLR
jgi:hypothetical protein